jgi:hypothetical protein
MGSFVNLRNVGREEAIFRSVIGIILVIIAIFISGAFRWVLGLVGVVTVLTAIAGY